MDRIQTSASISAGSCVSGVASELRASFDVWGSPLTDAMNASRVCPPGGILMHQSAARIFESHGHFSLQPYEDASCNSYIVTMTDDVWSRFVGHVEWHVDPQSYIPPQNQKEIEGRD
eukprot:TRINITY_DN3459_c0_g1_i5.p1 TRINITY_DN3459_c0_g1~~TRINITY_DN3459_c0_g1_i5.p1  ORF type:complete len:117 (+),score=16.62 TRINITY_DN3459_c0_g1_i5:81-431(+)